MQLSIIIQYFYFLYAFTYNSVVDRYVYEIQNLAQRVVLVISCFHCYLN